MTQQNILIGAITALVALIIVAAGIMIALGPGEMEPAPAQAPSVPKVPTSDEMKALAAEIAGRIDGDALAALKPGDENTPAYTTIHDQLNAFRSANPEIIYITTMRRTGNAIEQAVDADYNNTGAYAIGGGYHVADPEAWYLAGFEKPTAEVYSAIYGYAPILNASGAGVGLVCLEPGSPIAQKQLETLAAEIAGKIDGDAHAALRSGDENGSAYIAIHDRLDAFRTANPEITYIYTMRRVGNTVEYVVDADYGSDDNAVAIGEGYALTDLDTVLLAGFEEPTAEIYSVIYAYAPVTNASGAGTGVAGIQAGNPITQERLKALSAEIAGKIDGDALAALKPGDETTPAFTAIRDRLDAFRGANPGVIYIYTMRKTENATEYVVDADYGSGNGATIGEIYVPTEEDAPFLAGFAEPSADPGFYIGEWGNETAVLITGYAPVKNSTGAVVGLVGVDMGKLW
ncbi:hypothetical protein F8E02_07800 [Methanoculleus sp. Wushi-C6]|uniref:Cache domain-containing protein n=1 Tax=Methanoculleus caldifontis TaxID=2651577 RepID=A0ABU3X1I2_9EURY|nr:hypothetical protein [Methanoculleus sp. Wushi-C6]MDV2481914.1 hypothetical protein [Methanoculleus sp. Wushi-C6]